MSRIYLAALASVVVFAHAAMAVEGGKEIGFVESFSDRAETFVIHRGKEELPMALLVPIQSGDRIEVRKPDARVVLRLIGRATPVIVSRNNQDAALVETVPSQPFWRPAIAWAAKQIDIFDREDRDPVSASIRAAAGFSAPILRTPQALSSENKALVIGWLGTADVNIRLYDETSKVIVAKRGSGGIWSSSPLNLKPGKYVLVLSVGDVSYRQTLNFIPSNDMPRIPDDLKSDAIPHELRELAIAAWLAGLDRQYLLAALQHIAPLSRDFYPAAVLARALVSGARPERLP